MKKIGLNEAYANQFIKKIPKLSAGHAHETIE